MLNLFSQCTLLVTTDPTERDRVRDALNRAGIPFRMKGRSRDSRTPMDLARTGHLPSVRTPAEYAFVVDKPVQDAAWYAIGR